MEDAGSPVADEPDAADAGADRMRVSPIEERIQRLFPEDPEFGAVDREQVRRMMQVGPDEDGPFFMVNLVRYRERALYPDGRDSDSTGAEADALYGQGVLPILADIGAAPVFVANVETTLQTDDGVSWHQVAVVRYPTRASFFDMIERPDYQEIVIHKRAGVEETHVLVTQPTLDEWPDGFRAVDLASVPYPPTSADGPIAVVHLYSYRDHAEYADGRETDLTGREAVDLYTQGRAEQHVEALGVRPGLWLDVEGAFIGDERQWHEFRVNLFPSRATFQYVVSTAQDAGIEHRQAGLAHVYSMVTVPLINEYGYE